MNIVRLKFALSAMPLRPKVRHNVGLPREISEIPQKQFPTASMLLIEENDDGVFLYRLSEAGNILGDTWHLTIEDAKHQAQYEFEGLVGDWFMEEST